MDRVQFAGIPFCVASPREAAKFLVDVVRDGKTGFDVHFLNAYSIALSDNNEEYRECLLNSAYNFPDGKPISVLSTLGKRRLFQVRGPGLFESVMDIGRGSQVRHYLLGSTPDTLEKLEKGLRERHPGVEIVGSFSPPFRAVTPDEQTAQDDQIRDSRADVVWVGLGTPKQDFEVARLAASGFTAIAVGAAFDFSAGTVKEAPNWLREFGFEWLYRLATEPRRLWKRYLIGNFIFLRSVLRHGFQ